VLSLLGDAAVPAMLWLSWAHPLAFFIALGITLIVTLVLLVVFWRFLRGFVARVRGLFGGGAAA
jgi:heme/copper-type cytochrome/quinol oxidase subunit 2